jgi:hypothetical protein
MATTHHLHTPPVHRSTFLATRREGRRSARRAVLHRRGIIALVLIGGMSVVTAVAACVLLVVP